MIDQLEVLDPSGTVVSFRGERLEVRPLTVGMLPSVVRAARPVMGALMELEDQLAGASEAVALDRLMVLIEEHTEAVAQVVAIAIGRDQDFVLGAHGAEFMGLVQVVIEVNRDFFGRLLVSLQGGRAVRRASGAGPTASSSSSSAATD
ncbi:MAG TPA: hypothetical protein VGE88_07735 [Lysobacter sp.]